MASRVTPPTEEGAKVEGLVGVGGFVISVCGHDSVEGRIRNRDKKMVKDPHDSQRKNELITSRCIYIDIYDRDNEMSGEVNGKIL